MDKLYNLIEKLNSLGYGFEENKEILNVKFKYNEELNFIFNYDYLYDLKNNFQDCLNIHIIQSLTTEIDILDFLEDKEDFQDEIDETDIINSDYKLIFNKDKFLHSKFIFLKNSNMLFFMYKKTFISYLDKDYTELETNFLNKNKNNIFILGNNYDIFLENNYLMITNINRNELENEIIEFHNNYKYIDTSVIIDTRNENCHWIDGSHFLTPELIYIDFKSNNFVTDKDLTNIIYKKTIDLIMPFLCNFTGITNNKYISIINGKKRIEIEYELNLNDYKQYDYEKLYKIYKWIYEAATFDKINICRNVISILVSAKCQGSVYKTILDNSDWLLQSVQDNFKDVLGENIEEFFKEKNTLAENLKKNISGINDQITELTKLTITNITSLLGMVIAGTVGYIAKGDYTLIKMLSFLYLIFLYVNCIFNIPISIIRVLQYNNDFRLNKKLYSKHYPDDNYIEKTYSRNKLNNIVFIVYIILTLIITVLITYIIFNSDINTFVKRFQ